MTAANISKAQKLARECVKRTTKGAKNMKRTLTALVLGLSLVLATGGLGYAQDFQTGLEAYKKGDFITALREWEPIAEQGDAAVQYNLGLMYQNGQVGTQDYKEAVKWYFKSGEQGYAEAQYNLGVMYEQGQGVIQNYKEAANWFSKSAEQGYTSAQYNLGFMYIKGQGVLQDNVYAHMWWNLAASNGNANAAKNRDIIAKRMTVADISKAQELARVCVRKKYKGC